MLKDESKSQSLLLGTCVALTQKGAVKWLRTGFYTKSNIKIIKASVECLDVGVKGQMKHFYSQTVTLLTRSHPCPLSVSSLLCLCWLVFVFVGLFVFFFPLQYSVSQ